MGLIRLALLNVAPLFSGWTSPVYACCMASSAGGEREAGATVWKSIDCVVPATEGEGGDPTTMSGKLL